MTSNRRAMGPRTRILLAASALLALGTAVTPSAAAAAGYYDQYGRWHDDCGGNTAAGAVVGAGFGALAGSGVAGRGHRTDGSILGAVVGGVLGAAVGHDSGCKKGPPPPPVQAYEPPPPPSGYRPPSDYNPPPPGVDDRGANDGRYAETEAPLPDYDYGVDAPPPPPPPPGYVLGPAYYGPPSTEVVVIRSGRYPYYFYPSSYHYRHDRRW